MKDPTINALIRLTMLSLFLVMLLTLVACGGSAPSHTQTTPTAEGADLKSSQSDPLSTAERLAWSKQNVYDPETDKHYIPYHLWTGAYWDGNKMKM